MKVKGKTTPTPHCIGFLHISIERGRSLLQRQFSWGTEAGDFEGLVK